MMFELVYFDAGGTLLDAHPSVGEVYARAGRPFGLEADARDLQRGFERIWPAFQADSRLDAYSFGRDDDETRAWWRRLVFAVLDAVGFEGDREGAFGAMFTAFDDPGAWRVHDDVVPTLDALEAKGLRLGLLSNWDYRLVPLLDRLGLGPRFDPKIVSSAEGVAKPNREIYRRAVERAGVAPSRCLYVGDRVDLDLEPALEVGIEAYLIDRGGRSSHPRAVASLQRLVDLV